ncbi:hypothetical protein J4772_22085 [Cohnella sp. LGH]|uniref:hypothetical protein n=1 Tax=Cohnella sp. LGH TaxID=1619153 RepID=UPI001ADA7B3F|nr:hypothetical protein [Cohnella sp. LGH]QTH40276.1 hypothetical protein J4772_22085 [Cohnella sp. LGH]
MRRLIVYLIIIVYTIYDTYGKFSQLVSDLASIQSFDTLFIYSAVVIYIAIDRLLKELVSDVDKFQKEKREKERATIKKQKEQIRINSLRKRRI